MRGARTARFTYRRGAETYSGLITPQDVVYLARGIGADGVIETRAIGYIERDPQDGRWRNYRYQPVGALSTRYAPGHGICARWFSTRAAAARWLVREWERWGVQ